MKGKLLILSLLTVLCSQSLMHAAVITSVQSGNYSDAATWGGVAPAPNDDIVISTGHTVTLDVNATVKNVTIKVGAILDNSTYDLLGTTTAGATSNYTNNGTHNGTGKFILSTQGRTFLDGSGNTNCIIQMRSYGMEITNTCNLTINNNIEQGVGFESPTILDAPQFGGMLTINGNITTILTRGGSIINLAGTININGNVSLGGTSSGSGSVIENRHTLNISGDLYLGPYSSYCQNYGSMIVGGDLTGDFDTYFIQEQDATVKFGGSIFPNDEGFLFTFESPITYNSIPNNVEYIGSTNQSIALPTDGAYYNLIIANSNATVSASAAVAINGDLTIKPGAALSVGASGSLAVTGAFTIESDATGTGSFITDAATSANVQRYISGYTDAAHGWHLLSSPVAAQAISAFHTPGSTDDFYKWDEPTDTWINRTADGGGLNGAFETNFGVGTGYLVSFETTATKTFSGSLNVSNVSVTGLSNTPASTAAGWQLLGNPFSSALTWNDGNWNLSNVDANCQIWNETNASYSVILPNGIIPSMNGFMAHASVDGASMTIPAVSRTHNATNWYKNTEQIEQIVLTVRDIEGQTAQPTIIRFEQEATNGYDSQYDSYFLPGFAPMFYSNSQQQNYALNTMPELSQDLTIPLGFVKNSGNQFVIELTENISGLDLYLTDKQTLQTVKLNEGDYAFSAQQGDNPNRFELHFGVVGIENNTLTESALHAWAANGRVYLQNELGPVTMMVSDLQGRTLLNTNITEKGLTSHPIKLTTGIYIVSIQSAYNTKSMKIFVR
jgi:hypothetical protein